MLRFHQMTGPQNKRVTWNAGNVIQYNFNDLPIKTQVAGKKYVSKVKGVKLTFTLSLANTNTTQNLILSRDDVNNILISQIQVDGTALGTLISAAYMKPGMLDIVDFVCNGGHMEALAYNPIVIPPSTTNFTITHEVFVPFGWYGCPSPSAMAPMTTWIKPGNMTVFAPSGTVAQPAASTPAILANYGTIGGVNYLGLGTGNNSVVASALMIWSDEITLSPGFQMTRFKSTAATSSGPTASTADTVDLKSFGKNSTLTGVQQRAAIAALFWATNALSGDGYGAGAALSVPLPPSGPATVGGITDISALFAGIEQTNDITPFVTALVNQYEREAPQIQNPIVAGSTVAPYVWQKKYPLFTADQLNASNGGTGEPVARVFPIFPPMKRAHISKYPIADGSPSYQITGSFGSNNVDVNNNPGNADHYSYLFGLYQYEAAQVTALIDLLARDDIGKWLYPSVADANTLMPYLKLNKKNTQAPNFSKTGFLPSKLVPASILATMT